jgi:hypothetical protein
MTKQLEGLEQSEQVVDPTESAASASNERDEAPAPGEQGAGHPQSLGHTLVRFAIDVVAPIAVFYGLRAGGVSSYRALVLGAVIPAVSVIVSVVRQRRVDGLDLCAGHRAP